MGNDRAFLFLIGADLCWPGDVQRPVRLRGGLLIIVYFLGLEKSRRLVTTKELGPLPCPTPNQLTQRTGGTPFAPKSNQSKHTECCGLHKSV